MFLKGSPSISRPLDKPNSASEINKIVPNSLKSWRKSFKPSRSFEYKPPSTRFGALLKPRLPDNGRIKMVNDSDYAGWIAGFTDGEGCFSVSFSLREKLKVGVEVRPSFAIGQKHTSFDSLNKIKNYLKCGHIRYSKIDGMYKYEIRDIKDLNNIIVPFFEKHKLETTKQKDFEIFAEICRSIKQNQHLNQNGIKDIIDKSYSMNPSGKRKRSADELYREIDKKFLKN
jgi:hypothetical protein